MHSHAPDLSEVRGAIERRVEARKAAGIVAGVVDDSGTHIVAAGQVVLGRPDAPDGDTVFEIGSITKAMMPRACTIIFQDAS
jgi:D-alanyl-D-alanine-carboxypeptidase/D-alanyl-D-alanine-endopeptidase